MFDIREELPYEEETQKEDKAKSAVPPSPAKPQMRYLIKKGGKQIVRKWPRLLPTPEVLYQR